MKDNIKEYWDSHKFHYYTFLYILQFLISMYGKESVASYTTIARYMKKTLGLSFKRISYRPSKILTQDIKANRSDYTKFIRLCHQSKVKVIQIDEFTVGRGTMPKMAWTERGKSGFTIRTQPNGRFSVIVSILNTNLELVTISDSNMNRNEFLEFMKLLSTEIDKRYEGVKKKVAITMDGARYHWVSEISKYWTDHSLMVVQTPLYMPEFPL